MSAANALDHRSATELAARNEDPEGGAQDVRRFPLGQEARSENPRARSDLARELWRSVFFGYFLLTLIKRK
ncbi:hypothetical protein [Lysobacter silvisoli]|uniref:hypothetical protein n=1 Tax=Lysobacter silvisoli TaxID=2293254 RepID=UPI0011C03124|nr:hypothetical protein [Lysobacter silvisoli]